MNSAIWKDRLDALNANHLTRHMRVVNSPTGPVISTRDGEKLNFCSNDYLGLANDPRVKNAMIDAVRNWGAGAASSRLVSGNTRAHEQLEKEVADFLGTDAAVVFPSGFQANVGAITALTQKGDAIFSDELIHASLVDGCRLSEADVHIYRHGDTRHLADLLKQHNNAHLKLIVTDAVFSMDGDLTPLKRISELAKIHHAQIYLDEAHGVGVLGPNGRGLAASLGLDHQVKTRVVTFGKALGISGAAVALGSSAAGLVRSRARSLLYTTATPPPLLEAIRVSLDIVRNESKGRENLKRNIRQFRALAKEHTLPLIASETPIQPVMVGSNDRVVAVSNRLWERGLFVQSIRPPTVPIGTSRLRVTLTTAHTQDQIATLVRELAKVLKELP